MFRKLFIVSILSLMIGCGNFINTSQEDKALSPSVGCGLSPPTLFDGGICSDDGGVQITVHQYDDAGNLIDGGDRTAFLEVPCAYNQNTAGPLLFGWHGTQPASLLTPGQSLALTKRVQYFYPVVSLYPDALIQRWDNNQRAWDYKINGNDIYFRDQALNWLSTNYCIDMNRIGTYGFSSGAIWSNVLGCVRQNTTSAFGVIEGMIPTNTSPFNFSNINPDGGCQGPTNVFIKYDDDEHTIPYSGFQYDENYWGTSNYDIIDGGQWNIDSGDPNCKIYLNPDSGPQLVVCENPDGGGHTWQFPKDSQNLANFFKLVLGM